MVWGGTTTPSQGKAWPGSQAAGGVYAGLGSPQLRGLCFLEQVLRSRGDPGLGTKEGGSGKEWKGVNSALDFSASKGFVGRKRGPADIPEDCLCCQELTARSGIFSI